MAFVTLVVGFVAGWFAKHYFGAKAQAALDAEVSVAKDKIKGSLG